MRSAPAACVLRCAICAGLSILLIIAATRVPHVNHTTAALALVLLIVGVSLHWGWIEALATSIFGGIGFDYFLLPPRGFGFENPEHWVTLGSFLLTAITIGQLSARSARNRSEVVARSDEIAKLYGLSNALLEGGGMDTTIDRIAAQIAGVFQARAVAFYDSRSNRVFRSGPEEDCLSEPLLRKVCASGEPLADALCEARVVPIRQAGRAAGSFGIVGVSLAPGMADAIAERVGIALARAHTAEEAMAAELARRSETLKSAVLDALAHEIKGPLATIKVAVTTLLSHEPGTACQQQELLDIIDEESDRIECWINDAIRVSGRPAGQLRLEKKPNSMKRVVEQALEGLGPLEGRPIEVRIPESLPHAAFDAEMIEKVIRLLLDNALKYSPRESPIALSAEFTGAEIVLTVEDRGPGVPEDERELIFESYYRGSSVRRDTAGTGLGLASARCIMEAHGGEIWVTGAAAGQGCAIHISLPATGNVSHERSESFECR